MKKVVPDLTNAEWKTSSAGNDEASVEVAFVEDMIVVRNSLHPDGPVLVFNQAEWDAFVGGAKDGEFDI